MGRLYKSANWKSKREPGRGPGKQSRIQNKPGSIGAIVLLYFPVDFSKAGFLLKKLSVSGFEMHPTG